MAGKVLLINHGNALMANTLKRLLGELQIDIAQAEPLPEKIKLETKGAKVLILLAGDIGRTGAGDDPQRAELCGHTGYFSYRPERP
jgi:hypothetical protein